MPKMATHGFKNCTKAAYSEFSANLRWEKWQCNMQTN